MSSSSTNSVTPTVAMLDQVSLDLHYIHPQLQKLLKSAKPRAGAQKAFDGMKEPLERVAKLYTASQQNQDWHSATIFQFYSSIALLAHLTKVINFRSDNCSQLAIEPELVERPTAADDLGLSLSEADDGNDLLQVLGFEASPPARSHSLEPTTGPSSRKPLTDQLFPKPPSTKPTVPNESAKSEVEVEPSVKKQKGKGKAKADSTTVEAPVLPTLSKKKCSASKKSNSEFKSKSVIDTDDASDDEFAPKLAHKTIVLKPEARKAEPVGSCPGPAPHRNFLTSPAFVASSPSTTRIRCSFSEETDASNDELLKLLAAISSHPKVVKMLGVEAVRLGSLYMQSLHMVADSQRMARLARNAFSNKLTQFVQSGHNPKSVLSTLDDGDSKFSPADEQVLADFFHWPILPSSGMSGEKAASEDGDDNDNDNDADGSLNKEAKAPPLVSKTTKAPAKVPDLKAKDTKAPTTSTSGTRTRSGQCGGKPASTSGANLPRGHKRAIKEEVKAGPSSKRTKVATKDK
ncbi:hypothetical protein L218DRAFT_965809 [Marasmius fiardii PR-910]|nr:hypothetical protein L218DRAFT_965809 [Marasmius fiardii PR-910]